MQPVTNFLKAVFNFFVGDWLILGGVALLMAVVALLENVPALEGLRGVGPYLLVVGTVATLFFSLRREIRP